VFSPEFIVIAAGRAAMARRAGRARRARRAAMARRAGGAGRRTATLLRIP
jgi:hypothetical protein